MSIKVSVVIPVHNPGRYLDALLKSLGRQSMPAGDFEVIFVDDGSTDGTGARLDEVAAQAPNVRTIHIPCSGWPGRPRNVGIDAARGEYIQFVDHDDELGDEALSRLYAYATENGSDVVVGKEVRRNKAWTTGPLFKHNRPKATLEDDPPLLLLLTPHKMFRREFLDRHGLRFFEGPRRLEDHPFVLKAYFLAEVISVLADYTCYYWHRRHGSAGRQAADWPLYYTSLRDTLDIVLEHTEPGPFRDRLLSYWYREKGLRRLGRGFSQRSDDDARALFVALRELTLERFPAHIDARLHGVMRVRAELLRRGAFERTRQLAEADLQMDITRRVDELQQDDGVLRLAVTAALSYGDDTPVVVERVDGRRFWRPPVPIDEIDARSDSLDFTSGSRATQATVFAHRHGDDQLFALPTTSKPLPATADGLIRLGKQCAVVLDPATVENGRPMRPGTWDLEVELRACGWQVRRRFHSLEFAEVLGNPVVKMAGEGRVTQWYLLLRRAIATRRRIRAGG